MSLPPPPLCCPDHPAAGPLRPAAGGLACPACGHRYAAPGGIYDLVPADAGYPPESREREAETWDAQAARYDAGRRADPVYMACVEAAAAALAPRPGEVVLDAGCGTGMVLRAYWRPGVRAVALDLSLGSLEVCRANGPAAGVAYVRGDLTRLPFPDRSFDRVVCANALQQLPGDGLRRAAVAELARVTRPGGRVVVSVQAFSRLKRRLGWRKENDRASGPSGRVPYVYRYEPDELRRELAGGLAVRAVRGAGLPLPYKWKLSPVSRVAERVLRALPASAGHGHMLVGVADKPAA